VFDGTLVKLIKFPAEHLTIFHGTLVFRGTPVENHCSNVWSDYAGESTRLTRGTIWEVLRLLPYVKAFAQDSPGLKTLA